ncbi:energy-coupling factor transporter transmembrane component T family protein [Brevibacillus migulae]|uniref:energy-coupling factor transporter transmembrane component T family protein n=1 Tax=Brevibacillus migulae TaxID=1644114 RepID=UPI00106EC8CD|nr:energy-coupling factor transporter transmembrane protein EcfT [Brevibacillus migulae]
MNFLQNFAIGQYVPRDSFVHRLDPRSKLLFLLFFTLLVFWANNWFSYGLLLCFLFMVTAASRIPGVYLLRGLKPVWFMLVITVILHLLITKGGAVYVQWGWFSIEQAGVQQAIYMAFRLGALVTMGALLTLTTTPMDLTDGLERLLAPLKRFNVPVHELALMLSIAMRFIPTLLEETDKIIKAQKARGVDFETGPLIQRAKHMIPIVIPLFVGAFRRAEELALAMEARGYRGGEGRTRLRQLHLSWRDTLLAGIAILLGVLMGWWRE